MPMDQGQEPRNCVSCKERKVRCDRHRPCLNCTRANRECVFPTTGRILRQPQRMRRETPASAGRKVHLMDRIHRLENVVSRLHARTANSQAGQHEDLAGSDMSLMNASQDAFGHVGSSSTSGPRRPRLSSNSSEVGVMVGQERGRLYVGDGFWADLQQELDAIKQNMTVASHEDDEADSIYTPSLQSSSRTISTSAPSFIFSNQSMSTAITEDLRPLPSQMLFIWQTFVENVDPFIKVLHVPTVSKMIHDSRGNFNLLPSFMEPLMFSIAFAAVKSLTSEEVQIHFRSDKQDLVARFRLGAQDSLSRADFINTKELCVVQALLVYTFLIRSEESQRYVWAQTGLISRIAVAIGLHRDGSHFPDIGPFEAEMRRRAWCYIRFLDFATGDFQVPEMSISDAFSDTNLPSNLDDDDLRLNMSALPESRSGHTDMTLCLLRCKIWRVGKHIKDATASMYPCRQEPDANALHQLEQLSKFSQQEFAEFLALSQPDKAMNLFTRTMAAVAVRRYELILLHIRQPSLKYGKGRLEIDKAFDLALGILEDVDMLQHGPATRRWAWQFYGFIQWQPLALVLSRLSVVEFDTMAEHAWSVVARTLEACPESIREEPLWQPLFNIIQSVKKRRLRQLKSRSDNSVWRHYPPSDCTGALRSMEAQSSEGEGRILALMVANDPPGPETPASPSTRHNDPGALAGGMDAIWSVWRREDDLLVEPEQSALNSLPTLQGQDTGDGLLNNPGWDKWNDMINVSEQAMLWDQWAF